MPELIKDCVVGRMVETVGYSSFRLNIHSYILHDA